MAASPGSAGLSVAALVASPPLCCEVRGVGQVFFHERDDDIEGKAWDRYARLRVEVPLLSLARARLDAARRLGDHRVGCRLHRARGCALRARDFKGEICRVAYMVFIAKVDS